MNVDGANETLVLRENQQRGDDELRRVPTAVLSRVVQVSEQVSNKLREIVALGGV